MDKSKFLEQLNQLIKEGVELINKSPCVNNYDPLKIDLSLYVKCHAWNLSCKNLIRSQFGQEHYFYKNFKSAIDPYWARHLDKGVEQSIEYPSETLAKAYAVLVYVKREVELGLVADAKHLYEADLFSNLLDQAFELTEKGYIVGGAVYGRLIIENLSMICVGLKK